MNGEPGNNWRLEWTKQVLADMERLNDNYEKLDDETRKFREKVIAEIATLTVKSGVWGLIGGMIPILVVLLLWYVNKQLSG